MNDPTTSPRRPGHSAPDGIPELTASLARDLTTGAWLPGPLERRLARRLLDACAGDGALTADRLRAVLWEGDIALTHAGEGRLATLFAQLAASTAPPSPSGRSRLAAPPPPGTAAEAAEDARENARVGALALIERLAEEGTDTRVRD
ncbi:hypothetical protein AB0E99_27430 [Streptomyces sp. NPDC030592]|uniref:hypothetical protein n=1 Tax=Streptomyces sp. NPDC030592 TaxID=3155365 RepID=UPI0033D71179